MMDNNANVNQTTANLPVFQTGSAALQTAMSMAVTANTNDLVAIATNKAEQLIRSRIATYQKALTAANRELATYTGANDTLRLGWTKVQADTDARLESFDHACRIFYNEFPVRSYSEARFDANSNTFSGTVSMAVQNFSFSHKYTATVPAEYLSNLDLIKTAKIAVEAAQKDLLAARTSLNNLDSLERQARATIASNLTKQASPEGAALVNALENSVDVDSIIERLSI